MTTFRQRIIIDWGTSSFRAYRFGDDGAVMQTHRAAAGILSVEDGRFADVLHREIGGWLGEGADIALSGMITSRNGWVETPYVETPASLSALKAGAKHGEIAGGINLSFMPGVCQRLPVPDVMRGEEIQVFGSFGPDESGIAVLPGTHSKWVQVEHGRITGFRSFMTGEVFGLLARQSILGRLMPVGDGTEEAGTFRADAFRAGVMLAAGAGSAGLLGDIFSARSGVLLDAFPAGDIADRLSGLVIGHEIAGATALGWTTGMLTLIGEADLCARYGAALAMLGLASRHAPPDAAVEGFRRLNALK